MLAMEFSGLVGGLVWAQVGIKSMREDERLGRLSM